ncbi:MAG: hypothetical protein UR28_C0028G0018 [Candidatus Peregrinibacteria bacterium GW2011_GWF2_33_10]|nr:MAG: hypothetical protein UR28_C0028G0018 [Candidatus Peregrinibacteria bacterium GW2011_GWF2_33_10]OGJ51352.1 MAG: hypothetical protein A2307_02265 [Candidatus Peregrinibacteria bacterium RIFOXYB2_FULL_33_20]
MEWDFTATEVLQGKVKYTLDEFLRDLEEELTYNFESLTKEQIKQFTRLVYQILYFTFIKNNPKEVSKTLNQDIELVKTVLEANQDNLEMLESIIMSQFMRNIDETNGFITESLNLELTNAYLKSFHSKLKI